MSWVSRWAIITDTTASICFNFMLTVTGFSKFRTSDPILFPNFADKYRSEPNLKFQSSDSPCSNWDWVQVFFEDCIVGPISFISGVWNYVFLWHSWRICLRSSAQTKGGEVRLLHSLHHSSQKHFIACLDFTAHESTWPQFRVLLLSLRNTLAFAVLCHWGGYVYRNPVTNWWASSVNNMLKISKNLMIENTEAELTKTIRVLTQLCMHDPFS